MKYPIKPQEGFAIVTVDNGAIPLHGIADILALSSEDQINLCSKLGINFLNDEIVISITETGKAYKSPNDREGTEELESTYNFHLRFHSEECSGKFPLKVLIELDECTDQPFVNFLGEIRFQNSNSAMVSVPLIGRGTASLEGKIDDAHAGLCSSGSCASFQERVAILSCILACFDLSRDDIELFRAHLLKICSKYFGIEDLISYTVDKAFGLTLLSYFDYMKHLYEDKEDTEVPLMLDHFVEFGEPHPLYFYELSLEFSNEEMENEFQSISSSSQGPDNQMISFKVRNIINKFILYDNVYLMKPLGDNLKAGNEDHNVSIHDVAKDFNSNSLEKSLNILSTLGLTIDKEKVIIKFISSEINSTNNNGDVGIPEDKDEKLFEINLKGKALNLDCLLKLKILLNIDPIDNVNFLGKIEIRHSFFHRNVIPLVGRGTVLLEGNSRDKNQCFCINGSCASFLQTVAIFYCTLVLLDIDNTDLLIFENRIKKINKRYYGTLRLLDYIFKVTKGQENDSYFEFVRKTSLKYSEMPVAMKTILAYNRLPMRYFEEIVSICSEEELMEEERLFDKRKLLNLIPRAIHHVRSLIDKVVIF